MNFTMFLGFFYYYFFIEKYYAGESITPETPPSFVCPFCAKLGFTEILLQEHVTKAHEDVHQEVVSVTIFSFIKF